jgi:hypothetical protein
MTFLLDGPILFSASPPRPALLQPLTLPKPRPHSLLTRRSRAQCLCSSPSSATAPWRTITAPKSPTCHSGESPVSAPSPLLPRRILLTTHDCLRVTGRWAGCHTWVIAPWQAVRFCVDTCVALLVLHTAVFGELTCWLLRAEEFGIAMAGPASHLVQGIFWLFLGAEMVPVCACTPARPSSSRHPPSPPLTLSLAFLHLSGADKQQQQQQRG